MTEEAPTTDEEELMDVEDQRKFLHAELHKQHPDWPEEAIAIVEDVILGMHQNGVPEELSGAWIGYLLRAGVLIQAATGQA